MIDLSLIFHTISEQQRDWPEENFLQILARSQQIAPEMSIDWDDSVPEDWGSIFENKTIVAIVSRLAPIAFTTGQYPQTDAVRRLFEEYDLVIIEAPHWDEEVFCINELSFYRLFPSARLAGGSVDIRRLSVSDIWYATIT